MLLFCLSQAVRLEALHRFTVLWHLTREIQTNRTLSLNRSFDRFVLVFGSMCDLDLNQNRICMDDTDIIIQEMKTF